MKQTRYEAGMEQLKQIDGIGGENVIQSLEAIAPDLSRYIIEFTFGYIYPRKGLILQEREISQKGFIMWSFTFAGEPPAGKQLSGVHSG